MTTPNKFFEKIFNENEKVINNDFYKSQSFIDYTDSEVKFLKYLSFYSKYKKYIRNYLVHRNMRNEEKKNYLEIYRQTMTYEEYIKYNTISDNMRVSWENYLYIFGSVFLLGYIFFTYKSPSIYLKGKDITKISLLAFSSSYVYYKYNHLVYSKELKKLYDTLSNRINDNPDMRLRPNKDFFDDSFDDGADGY